MENLTTLNILFWINSDRGNSEGNADIYCRLTVKGKRSEMSTNLNVSPEIWEGGRAVGKSKAAKEINDGIAAFHTNVLEHFNAMKTAKKIITSQTLKNSILGIVPESERKYSFSEIAKVMNGELQQLIDKGKYEEITLYRHKLCQSLFIEYLEKKHNVTDMMLEEIDVTYGHDFKHFLTIDKDFAHNTIAKTIKNVKAVLHFAARKKKIGKDIWQEVESIFSDEDPVVLEQHEIDDLWAFSFPDIGLEEAKDNYIFSTYTGYANCDAQGLTEDNVIISVDNEQWLIKDRNKTDVAERVMLLPIPLAIIGKYKDHHCRKAGYLLPQMSLATYNARLKRISKITEIPNLDTSHQARYNFATTITLENDVSLTSVQKMMGHKSIQTTLKYARVTKRKLKNNMQELRSKLELKSKQEEPQLLSAG